MYNLLVILLPEQAGVDLASHQTFNVKPETTGKMTQCSKYKHTTFPLCMFTPVLPNFLAPSALPTRWRWPKSSVITEAQSVDPPWGTTDRVTLLVFLFKLEDAGEKRGGWEHTEGGYCGAQEGGCVTKTDVLRDNKGMHSMLSADADMVVQVL